MNEIIATLIEKKTKDNLNFLIFKKDKFLIKVLILQLNIDLNIGDKAILYIKPTKISISNRCKFENVLPIKINNIQRGEIISIINFYFLDCNFEAILLNEVTDFDNETFMLFKASDISIKEKID